MCGVCAGLVWRGGDHVCPPVRVAWSPRASSTAGLAAIRERIVIGSDLRSVVGGDTQVA